MKYAWALLLIAFCSCKTLQVSTDRNTRNTNDIGVEWNYSEKVNEILQPKIDEAISQVITDFNSGGHSFKVHKKKPKDKDYLTIDFNRGKLVSKGEKAAGYVVSALGLIATPIILAKADVGFIVIFYYMPTNKLETQLDMSSSLAADKRSKKRLYIETGSLFANSGKQTDKLVAKFSRQLLAALVKIDSQIARH